MLSSAFHMQLVGLNGIYAVLPGGPHELAGEAFTWQQSIEERPKLVALATEGQLNLLDPLCRVSGGEPVEPIACVHAPQCAGADSPAVSQLN